VGPLLFSQYELPSVLLANLVRRDLLVARKYVLVWIVHYNESSTRSIGILCSGQRFVAKVYPFLASLLYSTILSIALVSPATTPEVGTANIISIDPTFNQYWRTLFLLTISMTLHGRGLYLKMRLRSALLPLRQALSFAQSILPLNGK
jgi:hypothetical protein